MNRAAWIGWVLGGLMLLISSRSFAQVNTLGKDFVVSFFENGRDLIADAETALRNPSAQKFLVSVLSQRSRLENQRKRRGGNDDSKGRRQSSQPRKPASRRKCAG